MKRDRQVARWIACFLAMSAPSARASRPETVVTLSFDDGRATQLEAARILEELGLRGTFFINSRSIGVPGYLTLAELRSLQASGHELGGHTLDHVDLVRSTDAEATHQVCDDREALASMGLGPLVSFAYPYGTSSDPIARIVEACGYRWARAQGGLDDPDCREGCVFAEALQPPAPLRLRSPQSVDGSWSADDLALAVRVAEQSGGGWIGFAFHHVCDDCKYRYRIAPATLRSFLAWLAPRGGEGTVVRTMGEAFDGDTVPPEIRLVRPAPGERLRGPVDLLAEASDDRELALVEFRADGAAFAAAGVAPFAATWDPGGASGPIVLEARAVDRAGNEAFSAPVEVSLETSPGRGAPPPVPRREDPPTTPGVRSEPAGCGAGGPAAPWPWALLPALLGLRRPKGRRPTAPRPSSRRSRP